MDASLVAKLNYDDGYITLNLIKNNKYSKQLITGSFIITRSTEDDNYSDWNEIHRFKLNSQPVPKKILWTDYTIEQGKKYQYALQQYNDTGLVSDRILSNIIYSDFEDAFLYDGEKQLKIRYNPKVSNFKVDILESKVDTIGSKYPFILRNSKTYYKEFPISGLISYLMDENSLFYAVEKERNYHRDSTPNETLIVNKTLSEKIADERMFKLEVYNWLTNGKAKLFRSPTEGNYIIRLMNVSLTPNDTLGRMIHTFNSTAYEIAEYNYENLNYFGFITLQNIEIKQLQWKTIEFAKKDENNKYIYQSGIKLNDSLVETVRFIDMMPGDKIDIIFDNGSQQTIQIGITGSYYIDIGVPIQSIILQNNTTLTGSMVYSYYIIQPNRFNKIEDVEIIDVPVQQFIGEHDIIKEIEYIQDYDGTWLKNPKIDIVKFFYLHGFKRTSEKLKYENGKYYQDRNNQIELNPKNSDQFTIYKVGEWSNINSGYAPGRPKYDFTLQYYKDFFNNKEYNIAEENAYNPYIYINNSQVSVEDIQDYDMNKPGDLESLICGNGAILEVGYQTRNIDYHIERNNLLIAKYKQDYLDKLNELQIEISNNNLNKDPNYEKQLREETKLLYQKFISTLIKAQQEERKMEGLE